MLELNFHALPGGQARALLRKLRDLNLSSSPVAITRDLAVSLAGCLSLDAPVESGVRYRLRATTGAEGTLDLAWQESRLVLTVDGLGSPRSRQVPLACDPRGRAWARDLAARVRPDTRDARELEHFLRRVLRALLRR